MRHRRNGRSKGSGQFYALTYRMLTSDEFRGLSGPAVKLWLELNSRYKVNGNGCYSNNGQISLSMTEAARLLGLGKTTVNRAFRELEIKGFIEKTKQGQWYGRLASEWRLTDKRFNNRPATNDWKQPRQKAIDGHVDRNQKVS